MHWQLELKDQRRVLFNKFVVEGASVFVSSVFVAARHGTFQSL